MNRIKNILKGLPLIGKLGVAIKRKLKPNKNSASYWIEKYLPNDKITVVQIGANDGVSGDPIYDLVQKNKNWQVLFVEPVPYVFERLKKNYGNEPRFKFEKSAINEDGTNQIFYSVKEEAFEKKPDLPQLYDQIGSFSKTHIFKLSEGMIDDFIEETEVNCLTLSQLCLKNEIDSMEFLYIDAEGYDWKILSQLDLEKYNPMMISFEHFNLNEEERAAALDFLKDKYHILSFRIDFLCLNKKLINSEEILKSKLLLC